jgi:hypothetical protein
MSPTLRFSSTATPAIGSESSIRGTRDESTRLVKDATQNHYGPLRTSLGAFVAETAFIGGDNLFIEGISDQVLLAGMNGRLRRAGTPPSECLDLNQVTLVPGGSNVPYMLYLARGRDQFKPACAVLLDSDNAGKEAQGQIKKGGARGRPTVSDDLVVMLGDWATDACAKAEEGITIEEPEDLMPFNLAGIAARRYAQHLLGLPETDTLALADEDIKAGINDSNYSMWDAIDRAFTAAFDTRIGKAGFAKELLAYLAEHEHDDTPPSGADTLDANYKPLLNKLAETLRLAREREEDTRHDQRVERIIEAFAEDHPTGCVRDKASTMLKRIDAATDDTAAGDIIRAGVIRLRRTYKLSVDPLSRVADYENFLTALHALPTQARLAEKGRLDGVAEITTGPTNSANGSSSKKGVAVTFDVETPWAASPKRGGRPASIRPSAASQTARPVKSGDIVRSTAATSVDRSGHTCRRARGPRPCFIGWTSANAIQADRIGVSLIK